MSLAELQSGPSVAGLLDVARDLIVGAWDRGEQLEYLLVHPSLYDAIKVAKQRESAYGRPLRLLGLLVVSSASVPVNAPQVR